MPLLNMSSPSNSALSHSQHAQHWATCSGCVEKRKIRAAGREEDDFQASQAAHTPPQCSCPELSTQLPGSVLHSWCPGISRDQKKQICSGASISGFPGSYFCSARTLFRSVTFDSKPQRARISMNCFLAVKLNVMVLRRSAGRVSF